jgi:tRNA (guanine-N7-)-methyltransferase
MEYNVVRDAKKILNDSSYVIKNANQNKNKWNKVFGNNNPIHLELGMGRGEFIIEMAKKYPKVNFIGLELNESQTATAVSKLGNTHINNLKMICADALDIINIFGREIDTIYLTFSEPWPKPIDERKRFTHESFLKLYDRVFKKNKHIILKTDNKGLFQYSLETLSSYWYTFKKISLDLHNDERNISNIPTDWELKCVKDGKPIYYLEARFDE